MITTDGLDPENIRFVRFWFSNGLYVYVEGTPPPIREKPYDPGISCEDFCKRHKTVRVITPYALSEWSDE